MSNTRCEIPTDLAQVILSSVLKQKVIIVEEQPRVIALEAPAKRRGRPPGTSNFTKAGRPRKRKYTKRASYWKK
jgi:hypothetical protein